MNEKIENEIKELSKEEMENVQGGIWNSNKLVADTPVYQPPRTADFCDQVFDY